MRESLVQGSKGGTRLSVAGPAAMTLVWVGSWGMSCIFNAIRLLKSSYGGYQQNEFQSFFGEFQIRQNSNSNIRSLYNDPSMEIVVEAHFQLREWERKFIAANADELIVQTIWQELIPEAYSWGGRRMDIFADQFRKQQPEVQRRTADARPVLLK